MATDRELEIVAKRIDRRLAAIERQLRDIKTAICEHLIARRDGTGDGKRDA